MKRLLAVFAFLLFVSFAAFGERLTGYISDEQCAVSGSKAAKATDWINPTKFESCAQKCAKNGSPAVFVTEDNKVLKLDVESANKASAHLGHRVSVEGKVENGSLKISKITTIKMEAQAKADDQKEPTH